MSVYNLPDARWPNIDLVGEYYRRKTIISILGGKPKSGEPSTMDIAIELVPEPDNPHSKSGHAISARIDGKVVGYLSSGDSETWYLPIHRIVASGSRVVTKGNIYAYERTKWRNDGRVTSETEINIRVALPEPHLVTPLNVSPLRDVAVLPWANALQVTGEENHLSHLFEYVPREGNGLVLITLHRGERTLKNGTVREFVEARLDGERVGQLSPAMSQHFLPTIRHVEDMDKTLGAWSRLKGSALAVELTVQGAKATDVPDEWLHELPGFPSLVPEAASYEVPGAYQPDKPANPVSSASRAKVDRVATSRAKVDRVATSRATTSGLDAAAVKYSKRVRNIVASGMGKDHAGDRSVLVGKKKIVLNDQIRATTPIKWRLMAALWLTAGIIFGSILAAVPGVGPLLAIAAWAWSIAMFVFRRRIAKAIEVEAGLRR